MRAAVMRNSELVVDSVPDPVPNEGEVLVTPENTDFTPVLVPAGGIVSVSAEGVKTENMPVP